MTIRNGLSRLGKFGITISTEWITFLLKLTERRTPIPAKITAAGWDTCMPINHQIRDNFNPEFFETHQANTTSDDSRKRAEDIDGGIEPLCQLCIGFTRLVEPGNLLIEYTQDVMWRMTVLEFVE